MSDDQTPADSKLTTSKRRWAAEGKFLTGRISRPEAERLPPGQHLVKNWPVLDLGQQPVVSTDSWGLDVRGLIETPLTLTWAAFQAIEQSTKVSDIHCVTTWSRYDNKWKGVSTRDLLDLAMPKPEAAYVMLTSYDGYTTNLPLADFAAEDAILATAWEGLPLTPDHGGPMRLVVPHLYFWKSAKWLRRIELMPADQAWLLGKERLSHLWRSLARAALFRRLSFRPRETAKRKHAKAEQGGKPRHRRHAGGMEWYPAPAWLDDVSGVEGLAAESTGDERKTAPHHIGIDRGNNFIRRSSLPRHLTHRKQDRLGRREIGMGAFVERALLIGHTARHPAP